MYQKIDILNSFLNLENDLYYVHMWTRENESYDTSLQKPADEQIKYKET